jgi:hypothetical protein
MGLPSIVVVTVTKRRSFAIPSGNQTLTAIPNSAGETILALVMLITGRFAEPIVRSMVVKFTEEGT